jgi:hypothetical protein
MPYNPYANKSHPWAGQYAPQTQDELVKKGRGFVDRGKKVEQDASPSVVSGISDTAQQIASPVLGAMQWFSAPQEGAQRAAQAAWEGRFSDIPSDAWAGLRLEGGDTATWGDSILSPEAQAYNPIYRGMQALGETEIGGVPIDPAEMYRSAMVGGAEVFLDPLAGIGLLGKAAKGAKGIKGGVEAIPTTRDVLGYAGRYVPSRITQARRHKKLAKTGTDLLPIEDSTASHMLEGDTTRVINSEQGTAPLAVPRNMRGDVKIIGDPGENDIFAFAVADAEAASELAQHYGKKSNPNAMGQRFGFQRQPGSPTEAPRTADIVYGRLDKPGLPQVVGHEVTHVAADRVRGVPRIPGNAHGDEALANQQAILNAMPDDVRQFLSPEDIPGYIDKQFERLAHHATTENPRAFLPYQDKGVAPYKIGEEVWAETATGGAESPLRQQARAAFPDTADMARREPWAPGYQDVIENYYPKHMRDEAEIFARDHATRQGLNPYFQYRVVPAMSGTGKIYDWERQVPVP